MKTDTRKPTTKKADKKPAAKKPAKPAARRTMPKKTLKFSSETLHHLSQLQWSGDGRNCTITAQLERSAYVAVDKALKALGGKWNRGKRVHMFDKDPRDKLEEALVAGGLSVDRDGFFETPQAVSQLLLHRVKLVAPVLEPSAGKGALLREIESRGLAKPEIYAVELNQDRADFLRDSGWLNVLTADFLELSPGKLQAAFGHSAFNTIVMNPPFEVGLDITHVRHAYDLLAPGGQLAAIVSAGVFFRSTKQAEDFRAWLQQVGYQEESLPAGSFRPSGTEAAARMIWLTKPST